MAILCNCCNTDNAPMAYHEGYLICDDCVERYGSYDAAVYIIKAKKVVGLDKVPKEVEAQTETLYKRYMEMNFSKQQEGEND